MPSRQQEESFDATPYVFVYGTLKYGYGNWAWALSNEEYIGPDRTQDRYVLGDVGFPYAFPEDYVKQYVPDDLLLPVSGDVFLMSDPIILAKLDGLEGEGNLYHRRLIRTENGIVCWMYHNLNPNDMRKCYRCSIEQGAWTWKQ